MSDNDSAQVVDNQELAQQLYDMLMRDIEPDLLSYNIPKLEEYYAGETAEENQARKERYQKAYAEFDRVFQAFMNEVQEDVRNTKRASLEKKEQSAREAETDDLESLEDSLDALPDE